MRDACEKCKKTLSVNLDAGINVDCLMEDDDLHVSIKRQEFEDMAASVFEQFTQFFNSFKNRLMSASLE